MSQDAELGLKKMLCKYCRYAAVIVQSLHLNSCSALDLTKGKQFIPFTFSELHLDSQPTSQILTHIVSSSVAIHRNCEVVCALTGSNSYY